MQTKSNGFLQVEQLETFFSWISLTTCLKPDWVKCEERQEKQKSCSISLQ